jgi:hypothetical protein
VRDVDACPRLSPIVLFAGRWLVSGQNEAAINGEHGSSDKGGLHEVQVRRGGRVPHAAQRRAVIKASPELQERERTKFAAVTAALAGALRQRGAAESSAELLARAGAAIFQTAFERWTDQPEQASLPARVREAAAELAASLGAVDIPTSATRVRP